MNDTISERKISYFRELDKQGKLTDRYLHRNGVSNYVAFLVKQTWYYFKRLTPKEQYDVLISKQFVLPKNDPYSSAEIMSNLYNNGYTDAFSKVDCKFDDNDKQKAFYESVIKKCNKNESFYKTFINILDDESLIEAVITDKNFYTYLPEEKKELIRNIKYSDKRKLFDQLSEEEQIDFIKKNPSFVLNSLNDEDIEFIRNPKLMRVIPKEIAIEIKNSNYINTDDFILYSVLTDNNNAKLFGNNISYNFESLSKISKEMTDEQLITFILHSKSHELCARNCLTSSSLHNSGKTSDENLSKEQFKFFSELSETQMSTLIKTDSNYILNCMNLTDIEKSKAKSIEIFKKMYGEEVFSKISSSFDNLFDFCKINPDGMKSDEHPLEEIKILFNDKILKSCSPEMINSYYNKLTKNEDITDDFKKIIQKTYGDKALAVLESRPSLNVHSINSLEVFDERIMDNFGEAFVHNCLTYNINDFQEFLEIIKDQEKLEVFKSYYDILCEVYGRNVETMQRSITEFSFNKELLQNVNGLDLSPSQVENLTNVLASEKNMLNINTLEELDDFNIKANEDLKTLLMWYKDSRIKGRDSIMFRTLITSNLFGMNYDRKTPYGETVRRLVSLYNFNDQEGYSSEEIKIMNILNFINKEPNEDKIIEFIEESIKNNSLVKRNMKDVNQIINKVALKEAEKLNEVITTVEKLEKQCKVEESKPLEERSVYEEVVDGIKVIHLEGIEVNFFSHDMNAYEGMNHVHRELDDILSYEGQAGTSVICTSLVSSSVNGQLPKKGDLIYSPQDPRAYVAFNYKDAGTDNKSKAVMGFGGVSHPISKPLEMAKETSSYTEAAFYRRERNMNKITNKNAGGKVYPNAIVGPVEDEKTKELCRKHNIAILDINESKYKKDTITEIIPDIESPVEEAKHGRTL